MSPQVVAAPLVKTEPLAETVCASDRARRQLSATRVTMVARHPPVAGAMGESPSRGRQTLRQYAPTEVVAYIDQAFPFVPKDNSPPQAFKVSRPMRATLLGLVEIAERVPEDLIIDAAALTDIISSVQAIRTVVREAENQDRRSLAVDPPTLGPAGPTQWNPVILIRNAFARCPDRHMRPVTPLKRALRHVTFARVADVRRFVTDVFVLLVVLLTLAYVYREDRGVTPNTVVIDPFTVPTSFEEVGLTPEVIANRIGDALRQIEIATETRTPKDNITSLHDEGSISIGGGPLNSTPVVEVPGTRVGLRTFVDITRDIFRIYPKHVSGDIVTSARPGADARAIVTVYVTQGRNRSKVDSFITPAEGIDLLVKGTAEMILGRVNPYLLAAYRYDHQDLGKAIELIQQIVQDPSSDRTHLGAAFNLWGAVLDGQKAYDEGAVKYQKALDLDPTYADVYSNWCLLLYHQTKYDEAIGKCQKALDLDPKSWASYNNWGLALDGQKRYDEAIVNYQKAIDLNPKSSRPYINWGNLLLEQKKYDKAIAEYQKAIDLDPNFSLPYANWCFLLHEQRKYGEAIAKCQKAIDLNPNSSAAYTFWGLVLNEQKRYDEAIAKYRKAIDVDPTYAVAYTNWGATLYEQKKYDEAIAKYRKATDVDPTYTLAYTNWGAALYQQKKYDEAIAKCQKATNLDPNNAFAYNNWGLVLYEQKKYDEAIAKYRKATNLDPRYAPAYSNWGNALIALGKNDEARRKFDKASALRQR